MKRKTQCRIFRKLLTIWKEYNKNSVSESENSKSKSKQNYSKKKTECRIFKKLKINKRKFQWRIFMESVKLLKAHHSVEFSWQNWAFLIENSFSNFHAKNWVFKTENRCQVLLKKIKRWNGKLRDEFSWKIDLWKGKLSVNFFMKIWAFEKKTQCWIFMEKLRMKTDSVKLNVFKITDYYHKTWIWIKFMFEFL